MLVLQVIAYSHSHLLRHLVLKADRQVASKTLAHDRYSFIRHFGILANQKNITHSCVQFRSSSVWLFYDE